MPDNARPLVLGPDAVRALLTAGVCEVRRALRFPREASLYGRRPLPARTCVDPGGKIFGPGPYLKCWYVGGDLGDHERNAVMSRVYNPCGFAGNVWWCREAWKPGLLAMLVVIDYAVTVSDCPAGDYCDVPAEHVDRMADIACGMDGRRWRPAITMPCWASRLRVRTVAADVVRDGDAWTWTARMERVGDHAG